VVPAPREIEGACLVKTYCAASEELKLCEVVDFYGILSWDPDSAVFASDGMATDMFHEEALQGPSARVPRLHCVFFERVSAAPQPLPQQIPQLQQQTPALRQLALDWLASTLHGDRLAAEYVLLHSLSRIYSRSQSMFLLGKLSLNLLRTRDQANFDVAGRMFPLLEQLLPCVVPLALTIETLSKGPFFPSKDYSSNRLRWGTLQLAAETQLLIDETTLAPGKLPALGVHNINALQQLISHQTIPYDFQFYQQPFDTSLRTLVISDGKSLFPADCTVPLAPQPDAPVAAEPSATDLEACRAYFALARYTDEYSVPEDVAKKIETDFVEMRAQDSSVSPENLNTWMQLARLRTASMGEKHLSYEQWQYVQKMEQERSARLVAEGSQTTPAQ